MKRSIGPIACVSIFSGIIVLYMGAGIWRGLDAIRKFPKDTVTVMQPVLVRTYQHKTGTGKWPATLTDVGLDEVIMPRLATPRIEVLDDSTARIVVHGPGHQNLSFTFFDDENAREDKWQLRSEGAGGAIPCPARPW